MSRLGQVLSRTWDSKGYERRERIDAVCECPRCHKEIELVAETEEWVAMPDGRWRHNSYDCAPHGECCGLVIVCDGLSGRMLVFGSDEQNKNGVGHKRKSVDNGKSLDPVGEGTAGMKSMPSASRTDPSQCLAATYGPSGQSQ
jgi:hypothetical protein